MCAANCTNGSRYSNEDHEDDEQVVDIWDTASLNTTFTSTSNSISHHNTTATPQENSTSIPSFTATLADTLKPIYTSYLQEPGRAKLALVECVLSTEPLALGFLETCKLVSEHDCASAERPIIHLITFLLTTHTAMSRSSSSSSRNDSNDSTPAVLQMLVRSPKDTEKLPLSPDEKQSYSDALRLAARALLDHRRAQFLAALFIVPSICAGSLEWFLGTFPKLDKELKEGLARLETRISGMVETCRSAVERMRGVERELCVLSGAVEGVKTAGDWVEVKIRDLERGRDLLRGEVVGACRVARYLIMTHGIVFNREDEEVIVVTGTSPKREAEEEAGLEMGAAGPPEKKRTVEVGKVVSAPAREDRAAPPPPPPGRGFYKGRNFDPYHRSRGRGYRGGGGGYWGQSPYRGRGGRPGEGHYY